MSYQIAVQLYSVRHEMEKDPVGTLKRLREIGFTSVEMAGYYELPTAYFKGVFDTLGMTAVSGHLSKETIASDPYKVINDLKLLGTDYIVIPYLYDYFLPGGERFAECVDFFSKMGELFANNGIQLLYHNHQTEFSARVNGDYILDVFYNSLDSRLVQAEIDTCWASFMGVDAAHHIKKYKDRMPIVHLKDYVPYEFEQDGEIKRGMHTCAFGTGELEARKIVEASKKAGARIYVIEQDNPYGDMDIFACLELGYKNLSSMLFQ